MMKTKLIAIAAALAVAGPAFAAGDAAKGESEFKKCKACHAIVADDGTEIVKGGKTGPNLYGVIGRAVASAPDFKYGDGILAVGATGLVWDEALLAEYDFDPTASVEAHGGTVKSQMTISPAKVGVVLAAY